MLNVKDREGNAVNRQKAFQKQDSIWAKSCS